MKKVIYLIIGILFGIVLVKSEVVSWFRIQEMFRFQFFFMYGVIGSAIGVGTITILMIKKLNIRTLSGEEINITSKTVLWKANLLGGIIFGMGWAMTGACPAPIYALIGKGITVFILMLLSVYLGTYVYGSFKSKFPH